MSDLIDRQAANDIKIKVIDSDKLINAINEGSYDVNLSAVMALGAVMLNTKKQEICEYCHEDSDGYVRPIEKNSHAWLVRRGRAMKLRVGFKGEYRECDILFCPMCGRKLTNG